MGFKKKKIPEGFTPDKSIAEKVISVSEDGYLTCTAAFKLADQLGISNSEMGYYADALDLRLTKCRIGLFGHGKGVKLVKKLDEVDYEIETRVQHFVENDRVNCEHILSIAEELKVSPVTVGSICQTKGIKIKNCCLGAF